MTNCLLPQSQDQAGRRESQGRAHSGPAGTHSRARRGAKGQPQLLPCSHPSRPHNLPPKSPHRLRNTVTQPPARISVYTCRITRRVSNTQYRLPPTPPKCHTNIYTQLHPHTNTHQLRLHRHPHQRSPGLSPTQTEELSNKYPTSPRWASSSHPLNGEGNQPQSEAMRDRQWGGREGTGDGGEERQCETQC